MKWQIILFLGLIIVASGCTDNAQENPTDQPDAPESSEEPDQQDQDQTNNESAETTDSEDNSERPENTVYYTDSGFEPQSLTIELGEEVTWVNQGSDSMWVASDDHPWHTNYAGDNINQHCTNGEPTNDNKFDQCSAGDTYSFTFTKTGTWGYHNHEQASDTGEIIVE